MCECNSLGKCKRRFILKVLTVHGKNVHVTLSLCYSSFLLDERRAFCECFLKVCDTFMYRYYFYEERDFWRHKRYRKNSQFYSQELQPIQTIMFRDFMYCHPLTVFLQLLFLSFVGANYLQSSSDSQDGVGIFGV